MKVIIIGNLAHIIYLYIATTKKKTQHFFLHTEPIFVSFTG